MRLLAAIGVLAILACAGGAIYFFGGFYDVSAIPPDTGAVASTLTHIREAAIDRHAVDQPPFPLNDPLVIQAGAQAFAARGCANCHGAPGIKWAKFSEGMRPDPPDLNEVARELDPTEIFWIVKHGINMTGMPSFARIGASDKEIWGITAFVKKLPGVTAAQFAAWTAVPMSARH